MLPVGWEAFWGFYSLRSPLLLVRLVLCPVFEGLNRHLLFIRRGHLRPSAWDRRGREGGVGRGHIGRLCLLGADRRRLLKAPTPGRTQCQAGGQDRPYRTPLLS